MTTEKDAMQLAKNVIATLIASTIDLTKKTARVKGIIDFLLNLQNIYYAQLKNYVL